MKKIGTKIKKLREEKGLFQQDLADELHVTKGAVGMWETNKRVPDLETINKIADFFNVSIEWLTGENIEFDITPKEFEDAAEIKCPICGYNYVHFSKTMGVNFNNIKSSGVAIKFVCEAEHVFYYVFETYKGNTYAVKTDGSTVIKSIDEPIYENAPISVNEIWNEEKYKNLDEHGKDMVNTVLDKEYQRCTKKNIKISDYTQNIAAGTGGEGFTEDKVSEVNDFAKQIAELEGNKSE